MGIAATVFLTLGVLVIGFGVLSLGNILNLPYTKEQARHTDITEASHRLRYLQAILVGACLLVVGFVLALLADG